MSIANLLSRTLDGNSQVVTSWLTQALVSPLDGFVSQSGKRFRAKLVQSAWDLSLAPGSDRTLPSELPQVLELVREGASSLDLPELAVEPDPRLAIARAPHTRAEVDVVDDDVREVAEATPRVREVHAARR